MRADRDKTAIIDGAGAIGDAVGPAFAREGVKVFPTGRTIASIDPLDEEPA